MGSGSRRVALGISCLVVVCTLGGILVSMGDPADSSAKFPVRDSDPVGWRLSGAFRGSAGASFACDRVHYDDRSGKRGLMLVSVTDRAALARVEAAQPSVWSKHGLDASSWRFAGRVVPGRYSEKTMLDLHSRIRADLFRRGFARPGGRLQPNGVAGVGGYFLGGDGLAQVCPRVEIGINDRRGTKSTRLRVDRARRWARLMQGRFGSDRVAIDYSWSDEYNFPTSRFYIPELICREPGSATAPPPTIFDRLPRCPPGPAPPQP